MKTTKRHVMVLVTAPDLKVARRVAHGALRERTAACVNLVPRLESHYWWEGRIESGREILLLIKTTRARVRALWRCVCSVHPYETPEFVVLPVEAGSRSYLEWISESVVPTGRGDQSTPG